jgi:hypothetical protein
MPMPADLMLERSGSAESLGDPAAWADWRRKLARKEMREGNARRAYKLASRHHLTADEGEDYADLEWLSGYIALRKLDDPETALKHFARYAAAVKSPISLGRPDIGRVAPMRRWAARAMRRLPMPKARVIRRRSTGFCLPKRLACRCRPRWLAARLTPTGRARISPIRRCFRLGGF